MFSVTEKSRFTDEEISSLQSAASNPDQVNTLDPELVSRALRETVGVPAEREPSCSVLRMDFSPLESFVAPWFSWGPLLTTDLEEIAEDPSQYQAAQFYSMHSEMGADGKVHVTTREVEVQDGEVVKDETEESVKALTAGNAPESCDEECEIALSVDESESSEEQE